MENNERKEGAAIPPRSKDLSFTHILQTEVSR
jgi:hypothetical protein